MAPSGTNAMTSRDCAAATSTHHPSSEGDGSSECQTIRETFDRVGDKWTLLVIRILQDGPLRFTELKTCVEGISQRMLTLTLRKLERDGLVLRTVYPQIPPRVEYALTPLGQTLVSPVAALAGWAVEHHQRIENNRAQFDAERLALAD